MKTFILGTDWWSDCDDAVAIRLLVNAHKNGKAKLAGICINACMELSAPSLSAYMSTMDAADIPIGIDIKATSHAGKDQCRYQQRLAALNNKKIRSNSDAENAVSLYRRLLANADERIDIIEIGFQNVLAELLTSAPDEFSPLSGKELIKEKAGTLWAMAGRFDVPTGLEHNICNSPLSRTSAELVSREWPNETVYLGWEVGAGVLTGGTLDENDTLKQILIDHGSSNGRDSWDPMTVLLALTGDAEKAGYKLIRGKMYIDKKTGANSFECDVNGTCGYVVKTLPDAQYSQMINTKL